jgi:sn-glycerol 3-phosphate transport system ATP-binding protein
MNAGRMEQIGTPEAVYARPATTFVASFIGSPPMNLMPGRAQDGAFQIGSTRLPLPSAAPRNGELILGVRPEHARPATSGWPLQVALVEMLGAERLVHGQMGDAAFTLRIDSTDPAPEVGQTVALAVAPEHLHWFDPASQQRVEA